MKTQEKEIFAIVIEDSDIRKIVKVEETEKYVEIINNRVNPSDMLLTKREQDVLRLITEGKTNKEIAKELIVSVHTAKAHVCSILQKLGVTDRVQAAVKAIKENLI